MFKLGNFILHSGQTSNFLIDCKSLTLDDLDALAYYGSTLIGPFQNAIGIPQGGLRFAAALAKYATHNPKDLPLIVDDVLTTGNSMIETKGTTVAKGLVIFARGPIPSWVKAIFTMGPINGK